MKVGELYRILGFPLASKVLFSRIIRKILKRTERGYHYNINAVLFYTNKNKGGVEEEANGFRVSFTLNSVPVSVFLRKRSSDAAVFRQVFQEGEYLPMVRLIKSLPAAKMNTIVDAGANIGLTAIQFSVFFPTANILSIEADAENFAVLQDNIQVSAIKNITPVHRALWKSDESLFIKNTFRDRLEWSRSVTDSEEAKGSSVQGITFKELIMMAGGSIDLLKIDIEGAEKQFFQDEAESVALLKTVRFLVIELHDDKAFNAQFELLLQQAQFSFTLVNESLIAFNRTLH